MLSHEQELRLIVRLLGLAEKQQPTQLFYRLHADSHVREWQWSYGLAGWLCPFLLQSSIQAESPIPG